MCTSVIVFDIFVSLYNPDLILQLQGLALHFPVLRHLLLCFTLGNMQVALQVVYLCCVTNM
jgi:hypothetical protein